MTGTVRQATMPPRLLSLPRVSPVVVVLALILLILIVPPAVYLVRASLHETNFDGSSGAFTLAHFAALFENDRFASALLASCVYGLGSAVVALLLGAVQAFIVERTDTPLRNLSVIASIVALGIPGVLYTIAFLLLFGRMGPVNQALMGLAGSNAPIIDVYTLPGMIFIQGIEYAPLAFLMLSSVLRMAGAHFEEASMMSGAGLAVTFRRVTSRLVMPATAALLLLVFIRAFEAFETPALVGMPGRVRVLTTDIYQTMLDIPPDYGVASAFSLLMLAIMSGLLGLYGNFSRQAEKYQTIVGKAVRPRVHRIGRWRWLTAAALAVLFAISTVLPLAILLWVSLVPYYDGVSVAALGRFTFDNFRTVLGETDAGQALMNTFILGVVTASLVAAFATVSAWLAVRRRPGAWLLDQLASAPLVFPAIVLAVAFLQLALNVPFPLYGTLASVVLASAVQFLPFGMRSSYPGILQIHRELEEASGLSGARVPATFWRIVLPLAAPALVTCWLFVFLMVSKSVSIPLLLAGANAPVVAVEMFDLWQNGIAPELAALGVMWTFVMTLASTLFFLASRRFGLQSR